MEKEKEVGKVYDTWDDIDNDECVKELDILFSERKKKREEKKK